MKVGQTFLSARLTILLPERRQKKTPVEESSGKCTCTVSRSLSLSKGSRVSTSLRMTGRLYIIREMRPTQFRPVFYAEEAVRLTKHLLRRPMMSERVSIAPARQAAQPLSFEAAASTDGTSKQKVLNIP